MKIIRCKIKDDKIQRRANGGPNVMLSAHVVFVIRSLYREDRLPIKEIARRLHISRNTVRKWIRNPELPVAVKRRPKSPGRRFLEANRDVIKSEFLSCEMLCLPLRRRLLEKYQIEVPLRTLERFCKPFRDTVKLPDKAFGRFESLPGDQMQVDFGTKRLTIGDEEMDVHVFVAKLGYSRRIFAKAFFGESFAEWTDGIESAFSFFGGRPNHIVCDNATPLINTRQSKKSPTDRFRSFCEYHCVVPVATAIRKPRSKGKVENAVKYVKKNALVGKEFESVQELNRWLVRWSLTESDNHLMDLWNRRVTPKELFSVEKGKLLPLKPRIAVQREEQRGVDSCGLIRVDNDVYRVPDGLIGKKVQVLISETTIKVFYPGVAPIELDKAIQVYRPKVNHEIRVDEKGIVFDESDPHRQNPLQRPLEQYDDVAGWGVSL